MPKFKYTGEGVFRYGSIGIRNGDIIELSSAPNKNFQEVSEKKKKASTPSKPEKEDTKDSFNKEDIKKESSENE